MRRDVTGCSRVLTVLVLFALSVPVLAAAAGAGQDNDRGAVGIFPTSSVPYGRTYGDWMAAWQQWATSMPYTNHPLFDTADPSTGQSGPVWFLGGKFCALGETCGSNHVVRQITVPAGTALFFPIFDVEVSAVEMGGGDANNAAIKDINGLRQAAASWAAMALNLSLEVDGVEVPHLQRRFHVQSSAFGFYLPKDDIFTAVGEGTFTEGYYFPGVDDGFYVMLEPLAPGRRHTIHFHAEFPGSPDNWVLDGTYHVHVQR